MEAAELVAPLAAAPARSALVLDVDGTLAPIAPRPELAVVPEETRAALARLADRYLLVACVSGRSGEDARRLVGVDGVEIVGNHGLELDAAAHELAGEIARFRDAVGLPVEDKTLSLTYHYREAEDEATARAELDRVAERAQAEGLDARWGRKVLEIRPSVRADKGTAVRALLERSGARLGLYAGDDTTDLDGFAGLRSAGLEHAVCVAVASDEGPRELREAADLVLADPEATGKLLSLL
jgi:trehalose 6-phosphate phosphatase